MNHEAFVVLQTLDRWGYRCPSARTVERRKVRGALARTWPSHWQNGG
jgi:hypothetical protein